MKVARVSVNRIHDTLQQIRNTTCSKATGSGASRSGVARAASRYYKDKDRRLSPVPN